MQSKMLFIEYVSNNKYSSLKHAEICPVHKKGNNLDVSNYRPDHYVEDI